MPRAWTAAYSGGRCGICDDRIDEGDECVHVDDEPVHADCAEDEGVEVER